MEKSLSDLMREIKDALQLTQSELAEGIGANIDRIKSLMGGKAANLSHTEMRQLVKKFHISPYYLITGEGSIFHREDDPPILVSQNDSSPFVLVPRYDVLGSAGTGQVIHSELIVDHLAFREEWVLRMGLSQKHLALIVVEGDSMEPTLRNSDLVLIDIRVSGVVLNGIYAIQHKGHLLIKRIQSRLDGTVIIRSDNPMYEPETLKEGDADNFMVVGRVVWFGREM